jgi:hypothetical protein
MAAFTDIGKKIVMRYDSNGSYTFNRVAVIADDERLHELSQILNSFQAEPAVQVRKVTTKVVM